MQRKLKKIAADTNIFLKSFIKQQKKTSLSQPMRYGLFPGGKKIRSKVLIDIGLLFNINYKILIKVGAAVECIHAYSLIHDDLPCMDNDRFRRGKLSTHIKYNESTAVLAGNSLLTMAFEILSDKKLMLPNKTKINLIMQLSKCSGHTGIAGGQFLDLSFENKKISKKKIIDMAIKKTGKLFSFCCMAPLIIKGKEKNIINFFGKIGSKIGLLFQISDDFIDYKGKSKKVGKKTKKDKKLGKATLISLLGYRNTTIYGEKIKSNIIDNLKKYGIKSKNINETLTYILKRNK